MPQLPTSGQWRFLILEEEETRVKISSAVSVCLKSQSHGVGGWHLLLFRSGVAALIWIDTDPHAERICRRAWPDVSVIKGDEESLPSIVHSTRFSHHYVKWVYVFSGGCSTAKKSLLCQKQNKMTPKPTHPLLLNFVCL